jgi:hypothetical protein
LFAEENHLKLDESSAAISGLNMGWLHTPATVADEMRSGLKELQGKKDDIKVGSFVHSGRIRVGTFVDYSNKTYHTGQINNDNDGCVSTLWSQPQKTNVLQQANKHATTFKYMKNLIL